MIDPTILVITLNDLVAWLPGIATVCGAVGLTWATVKRRGGSDWRELAESRGAMVEDLQRRVYDLEIKLEAQAHALDKQAHEIAELRRHDLTSLTVKIDVQTELLKAITVALQDPNRK